MSKIFKTDENYNYCELGKYDEDYDEITDVLKDDITIPNLRDNGGTLWSTVGLYYPETLIYLEDNLTKDIIGYMGLTEHYGKGLYISQIAVKEENRRQGVASILVKEAIKRAHEMGIDTVSADIAHDNDASKAFFSTFEFGDSNEIFGGERYYLDTEYYVNKHKDEFINKENKTSTY